MRGNRWAGRAPSTRAAERTGVPARADPDGTLDLARAVPSSGSYAEADAMGHIWSMLPAAVFGASERRRIRPALAGMFVDLGGSPRADARAGAAAWSEALRFLSDVDWFGGRSERVTRNHSDR